MAVVRTSFVGTTPLLGDAGGVDAREEAAVPERRVAEPPMAPRPREETSAPVAIDAPAGLARALGDPSLRPFSGLTVGPEDMNEATEREIVSAAGGRGVLCAYGGFDPTRRPVVLVHGNDDSPERLRELAAELDGAGMQVMILYYDDRGRALPDNAADLATALEALRPSFPRDHGVDILGHSAGGIIAIAALNGLASGGSARAGFSDVRVRGLDTGYGGYMHEPSDIPLLGPLLSVVTELGIRLVGNIGAFDMRGNSTLMNGLFEQPLEGVDFHNITASQPAGARDSHASVEDLSPDAVMALARRLANDAPEPSDERARLMGRALRADSHYPALRAALRTLDLNDPANAPRVIAIYEEAMGVYRGAHPTAPTDLARVLVEDLTRVP